jgi:hypothetical protein
MCARNISTVKALADSRHVLCARQQDRGRGRLVRSWWLIELRHVRPSQTRIAAQLICRRCELRRDDERESLWSICRYAAGLEIKIKSGIDARVQ